jgi:hypothetical protein
MGERGRTARVRRERKGKEGGLMACRWCSRRSTRPGKQEVASAPARSLHAAASSWRKKMRCVLHILMLCICLKTSENSKGFSAKQQKLKLLLFDKFEKVELIL